MESLLQLPLAISLEWGTEFAYMAAAVLFVLGIKRLSGVRSAAGGNRLAALAMLVAAAATVLLLQDTLTWWVVIAGVAIGATTGLLLAARVPMTAMPELVAIFNGLGGAASAVVAMAEVTRLRHRAIDTSLSEVDSSLALGAGMDIAIALLVSLVIGAVTLSGSLIAYAKLAGKLDRSRFGPIGGVISNTVLLIAAIAVFAHAFFNMSSPDSILALALVGTFVALLLGVGLTVPIGGADMPVAIALLNSYSGLAASATGFVLHNNLLIIAGSLVGASGLILTKIMCKAMNRSLGNVLVGGLGGDDAVKDDSGYTTVKSTSADEVAPVLDAASSVVIVPGYGLAVAQAQHKCRELASLLEKKGCEVRYAIHPVAGRMPGHMNILLAEADVPYEQLFELDSINGDFQNTEVVIVIGANDVCNPAANDDPKSPIAGMPVLHVWEAQTVVVIKRSLSAGYAGIKNELFQRENSLMLFADAKQALEDLITELKE